MFQVTNSVPWVEECIKTFSSFLVRFKSTRMSSVSKPATHELKVKILSPVNEDGLAPVWARITVDGRRTELSAKRYVLLKYCITEFVGHRQEMRRLTGNHNHLSSVQ